MGIGLLSAIRWLLTFVMSLYLFLCFFFQAEDGIRDSSVTGVQTCALPICAGFPHRPRNQHGYILLTLMLFVALLTIGMLAMVQNIESQIKRDREEELIHRGVQYSRAVWHYFKKFNRYPNRIEDLENTNNYRSLRKRYKDPITGKDFKPLHMTDVQLSFAGGVPGAGLPTGGLNPSAAPGGAGPTVSVGLQNPPAVQFQTANQGDTSPADQ